MQADAFASLFATATRSLDHDERRALFDALTPQELAEGEALLREGQPSSTLYFLVRGRLAVHVNADVGVTKVADLSPGSLVAEISFIDGGPSSATIHAAEPSTVLRLDRAAFERLAGEAPQVATRLLESISRTLTARIRAATDRFDTLTPGEAVEEDSPTLLRRIYNLFGLSKQGDT